MKMSFLIEFDGKEDEVIDCISDFLEHVPSWIFEHYPGNRITIRGKNKEIIPSQRKFLLELKPPNNYCHRLRELAEKELV